MRVKPPLAPIFPHPIHFHRNINMPRGEGVSPQARTASLAHAHLHATSGQSWENEIAMGNDALPAEFGRAANFDAELAYLLFRLTLGVNLLMHGVSRFLTGVSNFAHGLLPMFAHTPLPPFSVLGFGYVIPWIELTVGILVLFGLGTRVGLVAGSLLMCALTFGTTLRQDWPGAELLLVYAVVFAGMIALRRFNRFSLDALLADTLLAIKTTHK